MSATGRQDDKKKEILRRLLGPARSLKKKQFSIRDTNNLGQILKVFLTASSNGRRGVGVIGIFTGGFHSWIP
jgi:hypothetical protein